MAIAFVQRVIQVGSSSSSTPLVTGSIGVTTTVGNHLILGANASGQVISSVTDSKGNTWQVDATNNVGNDRPSMASAKITSALVSGDTITVNWAAATNGAYYVNEYSGLDTTTWLDKTASATGVAGTASDSTASGTSSQANSLIIGVTAHNSTVGSFTMESLSPAWTLGTNIASTGTVRTVEDAYRIVSDGPLTYSAKATWTTARDWGAIVGVYKPASGSVTVTPGTLALILSEFAPVLDLGIIPPTAALVLSTFAPAIGQGVVPGTAGLTLTTFAPVIALGIIPATAALVLTTYAPTVTASGPQTVVPFTLTLLLTAFAPNVTASSSNAFGWSRFTRRPFVTDDDEALLLLA